MYFFNLETTTRISFSTSSFKTDGRACTGAGARRKRRRRPAAAATFVGWNRTQRLRAVLRWTKVLGFRSASSAFSTSQACFEGATSSRPPKRPDGSSWPRGHPNEATEQNTYEVPRRLQVETLHF